MKPQRSAKEISAEIAFWSFAAIFFIMLIACPIIYVRDEIKAEYAVRPVEGDDRLLDSLYATAGIYDRRDRDAVRISGPSEDVWTFGTFPLKAYRFLIRRPILCGYLFVAAAVLYLICCAVSCRLSCWRGRPDDLV